MAAAMLRNGVLVALMAADNLDGVRRAIMAWVSEWRREDPDIDDATIAIYEEAANDLVTNPNLDMRFGYWIQSDLDRLVRQKRKGAGRANRKAAK
jgi:hypothetical protein